MATYIKQETEEIQGLKQESEAEQAKLTFIPEQCRILGEAYQMILSWRLERKMQPETVISNGNWLSAPTGPAVAVEMEA